MGCGGIKCYDVEWIYLAQVRDWWWVPVYTDSVKSENFLYWLVAVLVSQEGQVHGDGCCRDQEGCNELDMYISEDREQHVRIVLKWILGKLCSVDQDWIQILRHFA
jgi:hypothetical protein